MMTAEESKRKNTKGKKYNLSKMHLLYRAFPYATIKILTLHQVTIFSRETFLRTSATMYGNRIYALQPRNIRQLPTD